MRECDLDLAKSRLTVEPSLEYVRDADAKSPASIQAAQDQERPAAAERQGDLIKYEAFLPSLADAAAEGIDTWLGAELAKAEAKVGANAQVGVKSVPTGPGGEGDRGASG